MPFCDGMVMKGDQCTVKWRVLLHRTQADDVEKIESAEVKLTVCKLKSFHMDQCSVLDQFFSTDPEHDGSRINVSSHPGSDILIWVIDRNVALSIL